MPMKVSPRMKLIMVRYCTISRGLILELMYHQLSRLKLSSSTS